MAAGDVIVISDHKPQILALKADATHKIVVKVPHFLTMRLASLAALALLAASSCQSARPKESDAGRAASGAVVEAHPPAVIPVADVLTPAPIPDASREESFVHISAFDCEKLYEAPGFPKPTGAIKSGISEWRGGGPDGANWNVEDLRCVVAVTSTCSKAQLYVAIRVGTKLAAEKKLDLGTSPRVDVELEVSYDRWRKNLDEPLRPPGLLKVPYKTAVFRAVAQIRCSQPVSASAADWKYPAVTAESSFVAGFASGE